MIQNVHVYPSAEEMALELAKYLVNLTSCLLEERDPIYIAVSGGTTPQTLFELLAGKFHSQINWNKIHLFWVDERCVPANHPESNYGMTYETLLRHIDMPKQNIHPIDGGNDPEKELVRYTREMKEIVPLRWGCPIFDILLLGMGNDGHIASIFPENLDLFKTKDVAAITVHPQTGQKRITLTGRTINNASNVLFHVTGMFKDEIVSRILEKKSHAEKYPVAHINPVGDSQWFLDKEAAVMISE